MNELHTDGNELAGLLGEILAADPTTMLRICQSCGDQSAIAAHRAFHGAGVVLRCPSCDDVAVVIGVSDDRLTLEWRGTYRVARAG